MILFLKLYKLIKDRLNLFFIFLKKKNNTKLVLGSRSWSVSGLVLFQYKSRPLNLMLEAFANLQTGGFCAILVELRCLIYLLWNTYNPSLESDHSSLVARPENGGKRRTTRFSKFQSYGLIFVWKKRTGRHDLRTCQLRERKKKKSFFSTFSVPVWYQTEMDSLCMITVWDGSLPNHWMISQANTNN